MRTVLASVFALLLLVGSSISAMAANQAPPKASESTPVAASSSDVNPANPKIGDPVTLFSEDGDAMATVTVTDVERDWQGFDKYQEPDKGTEYVAVTIKIDSTIAKGALEVKSYDFSLQDGHSFLWGTTYATNEDSGDEIQVLSDDLLLANGESGEFLVIFQTRTGEPLQHVYWNPESALLTLADLSEL